MLCAPRDRKRGEGSRFIGSCSTEARPRRAQPVRLFMARRPRGALASCRVGPRWNLQQSPSKPRQKVELERVHVQHAGTVIRAQGNVASMLRQTAVPRKAPPTCIPNSFNAQTQPGRCKTERSEIVYHELVIGSSDPSTRERNAVQAPSRSLSTTLR